MSTQQTQEQLNRYLSFLEQDENNLTLLVQISSLYAELDDLNSAQSYLDKASSIDRIACLGHQGLLHLNQGEITKAQESFTEALTYEDTPALRYNLGFTYFISSDLENTEKVLSPLIEEEQYPEAKLLLARSLHGQGELNKALALVQNVLAQEPNDSEAMGLLALLHFDMDDEELAAQTALQALELNPENYDAKLIHAMSGLSTQETTVEEIEKLLKINPDDCRLWFALGSIHLTNGAVDLAEYSLNKAVEIYPEFYDCHIALGWCLLLQDKLDEAFNTYQLAAELVDELADSWGGLALVYALKEDYSNAEHFIQKSKELDSECFLAEIAETIYYNVHNPLKAKEHLIKALQNSKVPSGEKLALIIAEINETGQLH